MNSPDFKMLILKCFVQYTQLVIETLTETVFRKTCSKIEKNSNYITQPNRNLYTNEVSTAVNFWPEPMAMFCLHNILTYFGFFFVIALTTLLEKLSIIFRSWAVSGKIKASCAPTIEEFRLCQSTRINIYCERSGPWAWFETTRFRESQIVIGCL